MMLADRLGYLIIDEIPAVGLYFREDGLDRRQELCRQQITELIARDKNHPSVIMWSIANEPHSDHPQAVPFFRDLTDLTRSLDPTRPVTLLSCRMCLYQTWLVVDFCQQVAFANARYRQNPSNWKSATGASESTGILHSRVLRPRCRSSF